MRRAWIAAVGVAACVGAATAGCASTAEQDPQALYLAELDDVGASAFTSDEVATEYGRGVCARLDAGVSLTDIGAAMMSEDGLTGRQTGAVQRAAVLAYCAPAHVDVLQHP